MNIETLAFIIVLLSAIMHAAWNALVKINAAPLLTISAMFGCTSILLLLFIPWVQALPVDLWAWLALSLVLHFGYKIYLVKAFTLGDFSQAYPIARGSAPLWVLLFSYWLLPNDLPSLSAIEILAVMAIILGIIFLAPWRQLVQQRHLFIAAIITGFWITGYTLVDGYLVNQTEYFTAFVFWLFFLDGVCINLYTFCYHRQALTTVYRHYWRTAMLGGGFSLAAYGLCLWAMTILPVAMVSAVRETSVLAAVLLARWWLKEPLSKRHYGAALLICIGLVVSKLM